MSDTTVSLSDVQQSFVRQYMVDARIIGVRIAEVENRWVLDVVVDGDQAESLQLPSEYRGVPVRVRAGVPAILAFAGS